MPAVTVKYPRGLFTPEQKAIFITNLKKNLAFEMDAIDPETNRRTDYVFDPDKFIDALLEPYDLDDAELTAVLMATVVTYDWPDRMASIHGRLSNFAEKMKAFIPPSAVPADKDAISVTFLGKTPGCWVAV